MIYLFIDYYYYYYYFGMKDIQIQALFGLMEEEGKEKKGMTFLCLFRNKNKKKEE